MGDRFNTIIFLLSIFVVADIIYWFKLGGVYYLILRDVIYLMTPCLGVVAGFFTLTKFGLKGSRARTILFLTLGVLGWFIGEVFWNYYELFLHIKPFPSIADIFYLIAYPLLFLGLLNE